MITEKLLLIKKKQRTNWCRETDKLFKEVFKAKEEVCQETGTGKKIQDAGHLEDEKYMKEAIRQAKKAAAIGEVPIGCIIVYEDKIIGRGYNRRMVDHTVLAHAEILAMKKACKKMGDWRLEGCTMYITLEPCPMCAGAIVQARIPRVVVGSMNPKAGCAGSVMNLLQEPGFNHQVELEKGILEEECSTMLKEFFKALRKRKSLDK